MPLEHRIRIGSTRSLIAAAVLAAALPLSAHAASLRVVQDPVSGELRAPTAAEADAFAKAEATLRASTRGTTAARTTGPKEIHYPDGTVETKLDEDSMMYSVVSERADGSLDMECLPAKEARKFVKATAAKKPASAKASTSMNSVKAAHDHS